MQDPGPYWLDWPRPFFDHQRDGWIPAVVWRDAETGHALYVESPRIFDNEPEALLESQALAEDTELREGELADHPIDYKAYWWGWRPWLDGEIGGLP